VLLGIDRHGGATVDGGAGDDSILHDLARRLGGAARAAAAACDIVVQPAGSDALDDPGEREVTFVRVLAAGT